MRARPGGYVIALTYGPDADWVKNVLAAGGCELEVNCRGNQPLVRPMLRLGRVTDFLELTLA